MSEEIVKENDNLFEWTKFLCLCGLDAEDFQQLNRFCKLIFQDKPVPKIFSQEQFLQVADLARFCYFPTKRKVSGDPYFKHVLATVVPLCSDEIMELNDEDQQVMIAAAFLHDALELNNKNGNGLNDCNLKSKLQTIYSPEISARIMAIVRVLTPEEVDKSELAGQKYLDFKLSEVEDKFKGERFKGLEGKNLEILRLIKTADVLANLRETVIDIESGYDNGIKMFKKPYVWLEIFALRIEKIKQLQPNNLFLEQLDNWLVRLADFMINGELIQNDLAA